MNIMSLIVAVFLWSAVATVAAAFALTPGSFIHVREGWIGGVTWTSVFIAALFPLTLLGPLGAMKFDSEYCVTAAVSACVTLIPALAWAGCKVRGLENPSWLWMFYWGELLILVVIAAAFLIRAGIAAVEKRVPRNR